MIPELFNKVMTKKFHVADILFCLVVLMAVCLWGLWNEVSAEESDFGSHDGCSNCFSYFDSSPRKWSGPVDVYFNPAGIPDWLAIPDIERNIERSLRYMSLYISHSLVYKGRADLDFIGTYSPARRNTVLVGFESTGFLGRADIWWNWEGNNNLNYGEVKLSPIIAESKLPGTSLHEFVHIMNIDHNLESPHSIMSVPYNSIEYQATLRLDDILALQSLYTAKPNRMGVITSYDGSEACTYSPVMVYEDLEANGVELCGTITSVTLEE